MSDITKCPDIRCPSRHHCYRVMAEIGPLQSYADFNREPDAEKCESFWPTEEHDAKHV